MLPILNFFGNHSLDLQEENIDELKYYVILELRKLPIPELVLQIEYSSLCKQFPGDDLSTFLNIKNWNPISFPFIPSIGKIINRNIVSIGPMGMRIVFAPHHIILPEIIYERIDWYSPMNKENIQAIRFFYYTIVNHFGGDHALYVDERIRAKFDFSFPYSNGSGLSVFEQSLISRYGISNKSLFDYAHGKYPKYYIDTFSDIINKAQEKESLEK